MSEKSAKETLSEKRQHTNWHRLLVKPIYLADGKVLFTLKDAALRVLAVPASSSSRVAAERILNAALHGGDMSSTHVAVRLALRDDIQPSANQKLPRPASIR